MVSTTPIAQPPQQHQAGTLVFDVADPERRGKIIRAGAEVSEVRYTDGAELALAAAGQADRRAGNAFRCEHCSRPLQPKPGSRRQRFCDAACRQAAHRLKEKGNGAFKPGGVHVDPPGLPLSRSNPIDAIEADLIAGLGDLGDLEPQRREFWLRRVRQAAERQHDADRQHAHHAVDATARIERSTIDPVVQAKVDKLVAEIPADLSIPDFLRRAS